MRFAHSSKSPWNSKKVSLKTTLRDEQRRRRENAQGLPLSQRNSPRSNPSTPKKLIKSLLPGYTGPGHGLTTVLSPPIVGRSTKSSSHQATGRIWVDYVGQCHLLQTRFGFWMTVQKCCVFLGAQIYLPMTFSLPIFPQFIGHIIGLIIPRLPCGPEAEF